MLYLCEFFQVREVVPGALLEIINFNKQNGGKKDFIVSFIIHKCVV